MTTPRTLLALLALPLVACITDDPAGPRAEPIDASAWLEPSHGLERQIARHAEEVRRGRELETFAREAEWFAGVGEPAYPTLLEFAGESDVRLASFGLATISALRDPRLLAPLREQVAFPEDRRLQSEYARALVSMGDWTRLDVILESLESEDVTARGAALKTLRQATGETFGFHPQAPPEERAAAVVRWHEWWGARAADPLLSNGG